MFLSNVTTFFILYIFLRVSLITADAGTNAVCDAHEAVL